MKKLLALFALAITFNAFAFTGNERPIKFIIPFTTGGVTDTVARLYEKHLNAEGYKVSIEYKPGAGGLIAKKDFVEKPDNTGYTLLMISSVGLAFDDVFAKDNPVSASQLSLVSDLFKSPATLMGSSKSPKTWDELKKHIANGNSVTFGVGSFQAKITATMILREELNGSTDKNVIALYKGAAGAINDVLGAHVDYTLMPLFLTKPHLESGKANILFLDTKDGKRNPNYPNIPSTKELGFTNRLESVWGVVLPKDVDKSAVEFYTRLFKKIVSSQSFQEDIHKLESFMDIQSVGPEAMKANYESLKLKNSKIDITDIQR